MVPQQIVALSDTSQLAHNLPLSSLSVLIFTAVWSIESQHALNALQKASTLTSCRSSIQFYELPWPPSRNIFHNRKKPKLRRKHFLSHFPSGFRKLKSLSVSTRSRDDELVHSNITNTVPWLPCIQLYINNSEGVIPFIYKDSFDALSIASFLNQACESIRRPPLEKEVDILASTNPEHYISKRLIPVSRDRFATYLNIEGNSGTCGLLLVLRGGTQAIHHEFPKIWNETVKVVNILNSNIVDKMSEHPPCQWSVTIVDADVDHNLAENIGFDGNLESLWFVLINTVRDSIRIVKYSKNNATSFDGRNLMQKLLVNQKDIAHPHAVVSKLPDVKPEPKHRPSGQNRLLSYFERPISWRPYFSSPRSHISTQDWLIGRYDRKQKTPSTLWMVIYQPWCGYCQRVLGIYRRFAGIVHRANVDVHVLFVEDVSAMPSWIDDAVDGFPTIIIVRQLDYWSSVEEFRSPHNVRQLIEYHDTHLSQVLWAHHFSETFSVQ